MTNLRLANIRNGLAYPHDDVCYFQSQWGHHMGYGYFRLDSMPYSAVIHLLRGGSITVVDATQHHRMSDALKFGVTTWCLVFNRALGEPKVNFAPWVTTEMLRVAQGNLHRPTIRVIRKLIKLYGATAPLVYDWNVFYDCHLGFAWDDKDKELRDLAREVVRERTRRL